MEREELSRIYADLYSVLELTLTVGWDGIREISFTRILYLSSVLYSFNYPEKKNPFSLDYNFSISIRGPYFGEISRALNFLIVNKYIKFYSYEGIYKLGTNVLDDVNKIPNYMEKREWLKIVIYILGIYGEEKIYDFIFRDPEYQKSLNVNSQKTININNNNDTVDVLNRFKKAFEKTLNDKEKIDTLNYLKLYFEYVFSVILKGEDEL